METRASSSIFFFSSRRRHTRLVSDWSSDVCSSDLPAPRTKMINVHGKLVLPGLIDTHAHIYEHVTRSEERRVGKGVDPGGRRVTRKKKQTPHCAQTGTKYYS